jgi:hypothetical protein
LPGCRFDHKNLRRKRLFFFFLHRLSFYEAAAAAVAPPTAKDNSLITKPTSPITPMPNKLIFIDSQSSALPGFTANFTVLAH